MGTTTVLTVFRAGKKLPIPVTLGTRPNLEHVAAKDEQDEGSAPAAEQHEKYGMAVQNVPPQLAEQQGVPRGALVAEVTPGTPADAAQLAPGMVIVEAGGKPVRSAGELERVLSNAKPGSVVLLRVQIPGERGGRLLRALEIPAGSGGRG